MLRRVNVLRFAVPASSVFDVFKRVCDSIVLVPLDYVNVYHIEGYEYIVMWYKTDQRKVVFPSDFRFVMRYPLSSKGGFNSLMSHGKLRRVLTWLYGLTSLCCMSIGAMEASDPFLQWWLRLAI